MLGIFIGIMVCLTVYSQFSSRVVVDSVMLGGRSHSVLVASSPTARYQGLSGKTKADLGAEGMMFVFSSAQLRTFVMRGMLFPLDFVWVNDGKVVQVDENIAAPVGNEKPLQVSSKVPVDTVLEFPSGFVKANSLSVGDTVSVR